MQVKLNLLLHQIGANRSDFETAWKDKDIESNLSNLVSSIEKWQAFEYAVLEGFCKEICN